MFEQMIKSLKERIENILKIGSYTNINGSDGKLQKIQIKTLRNIEDAMKVGQFGFNSKAPLETRCIVAKVGNENIIIANEHIASIIDIASGDSIVYNENGDYVKVEKDLITIKAKELIINADDTTINGDTTVNGNFEATGTIEGFGVTDTVNDVTLSTHQTPTSIGDQTPIPGT